MAIAFRIYFPSVAETKRLWATTRISGSPDIEPFGKKDGTTGTSTTCVAG